MTVPLMGMPTLMVMTMSIAENYGTGDIYNQPRRRDHNCFSILNRLRMKKSLHRAKNHQPGNAQQKYGAGKSGQYLYLPCPEGKPLILGIPSRGDIGERTQANGNGMRTHVPAVSHKGHRIEFPPGDDFDQHQRGCDPHDSLSAFLSGIISPVKDMIVGPVASVFRVHLPPYFRFPGHNNSNKYRI